MQPLAITYHPITRKTAVGDSLWRFLYSDAKAQKKAGALQRLPPFPFYIRATSGYLTISPMSLRVQSLIVITSLIQKLSLHAELSTESEALENIVT